jgi:hypothetical protein
MGKARVNNKNLGYKLQEVASIGSIVVDADLLGLHQVGGLPESEYQIKVFASDKLVNNHAWG